MGYILYWIPNFWKAKVYTKLITEAQKNKLAKCSWVLFDEQQKTIGSFGLSQIDNAKFQLNEPLSAMNLYNMEVFLHSDFQRRGVMTQITKYLFDQVDHLKLDIDGLWIRTLPNNIAVNHLAEKLGFQLIKQMAVSDEILPLYNPKITFNLYAKLFRDSK